MLSAYTYVRLNRLFGNSVFRPMQLIRFSIIKTNLPYEMMFSQGKLYFLEAPYSRRITVLPPRGSGFFSFENSAVLPRYEILAEFHRMW